MLGTTALTAVEGGINSEQGEKSLVVLDSNQWYQNGQCPLSEPGNKDSQWSPALLELGF